MFFSYTARQGAEFDLLLKLITLGLLACSACSVGVWQFYATILAEVEESCEMSRLSDGEVIVNPSH